MAKQYGVYTPMLWEGKKGGKQTAVRELNMEVRPLLDEMIVEKATDYIKKNAKGDKPFFTYVCLSHVHFPEQPHPDFFQTDSSRFGPYADLMAEQDHRVRQVVDAIQEDGISEDTLIVFCSDNAALDQGVTNAWGGSNGPWRGSFYQPPWEGCYRTGCMVSYARGAANGVTVCQCDMDLLQTTTRAHRSQNSVVAQARGSN